MGPERERRDPAWPSRFGDATLEGTVDASATGTTAGPGGNLSCGTSEGGDGSGSTARNDGASGGGGGGFVTAGGSGGRADTDTYCGGSEIGGAARTLAASDPLLPRDHRLDGAGQRRLRVRAEPRPLR